MACSSSSSSSSTPIPYQGLLAEWTVDSGPLKKALCETTKNSTISINNCFKWVVEYLETAEEERSNFFGPKQWTTCCGVTVPAPSLPLDIEYTWQKFRETHLLVYIPSTVNSVPLSISSMGQLMKKHFPGDNGIGAGYADIVALEIFNLVTPVLSHCSYWVHMEKKPSAASIQKNYEEQQILLREYSKNVGATYQFPTALEAVVCIYSHFLNTKGKERLFSKSATRCEDLMEYRINESRVDDRNIRAVVNFLPEGAVIHEFMDDKGFSDVGVAGVRRL